MLKLHFHLVPWDLMGCYRAEGVIFAHNASHYWVSLQPR